MTLKWEYLVGDAREVLKTLPEKSIQMCVTSPPYDGTLWLNLGDSYAGSGKGGQSEEKRSKNWQPKYVNKGLTPKGFKAKDLYGIPWRVAFALQADGWWLRSDIIWHKPNPMPESATDRPTRTHEYIFLLTKSAKYFYNGYAIREPAQDLGTRKRTGKAYTEGVMPNGQPHGGCLDINFAERGRNKRTVWKVSAQKCSEAHFAIFPEALIEPCILAGSKEKDIVLNPFAGSGTTLAVSRRLGRSAIGIDINPEYEKLAKDRAKLRVRDINSFGGGG